MNLYKLCVGLLALFPAWSETAGQIEPNAGNWKTWVISSGKDYRVPPPPDAAATQSELQWLKGFLAASQADQNIPPQITYWDAGSPAYRWIDLVTNRLLAGQLVLPGHNPLDSPVRIFAYLATAMYDATVAAWDSKYAYNRPRPSEADPTIKSTLPVPRSPSYPSEHAATAAAAAEVLAYFFPADAATYRSLAEEAARSRVFAGLQFPSDYSAGMDLGRQVAARVIEKAKADGFDTVWTGTVPTGKCMWVGTNPLNVTGPSWKPFLLSSASEFRPPPPPACDSPTMVAQVADVRNFPRSPAAFATNERAFYYQSLEGAQTFHYRYANQWIAEDKLDQNAPRAARVYALLATSMWDSAIASQDGKFTYWYLRPHMLDPAIVPLFPVPNFPSYPSNHSTLSTLRGEILAYLFPTRADFARSLGKQAGDSRIWAGIHYEIDNQAGVQLGKAIAQKYLDWASKDGSQ